MGGGQQAIAQPSGSSPGVCLASQQGGLSGTGVTPYISGEVGANNATNRDATISLDDSWRTAAETAGFSDFQTWIDPGSDTTIASPYQLLSTANVDVFVSSLDMNDIDTCLGTTTSSAISIVDNSTLQDNAPRPNATVSDPVPDLYDTSAQPRYWSQSGGSGTSRNAVLFEFSSPVAAFGAWFGDLETRTDNGTAAILRLLDVNDVQIGSDQIIEPDPSFFNNQSECGGANSSDITGCGNSTTRWIGFVDPLARVAKMVVIVGDDDLGGNGNSERLSFIGATLANSTGAPITLDYGDAPDTYGTDDTAGNSSNSSDPIGASHQILANLFLGATPPDEESNGFVDGIDDNGNATDDDDPTGTDDEDDFTLPTLREGDTSYTIPAANITATNTTGVNATLHAWIDFDNSGTFETSEHTSVAVNDGSNGGNPERDLSWTGITAGAAGNTYARFRLTTDSAINNTTPGGSASDGEVEDYQMAIAPPPANTISGKVFEDFGAGTTGNDVPEAGENGLGDITLTLYQDDGDGLFDASNDTLESITTSNSTDGTYSLGVNSDGTYFVVIDHLDSDAPNLNSALPDRTVRIVTITGADATNEDFPYDPVGTSFGVCPADAFLFQTNPTNSYSLNLATGSTVLEDTDIGNRLINAIGFSLTDSFIYGSNSTDNDGTISRVDRNYNVITLGSIVGLPTGRAFSTGDVSPDGRLYLKRGRNVYIIDVDPTSASYLQLESLRLSIGVSLTDWAFNPIDEQIYAVDNNNSNLYRINPDTGNVEDLGNTVIPTANNTFGAQFYDASGFLYISRNQDGTIYRLDTRNPTSIDPTATFFANGPNSNINDGARCLNAPIPIDFGDAPETYNTSLSNDGARHILSSSINLYLGSIPPDAEIDGQASNAADGDGSDEDDLTFPTLTSGSTSFTIPATNIIATNTTGVNATLHAWIDFDNSGTFESTEHTSVAVNDGSNGDNPAADLTWTGINVAVAENTYARFRLTTDSSIDNTTPEGVASDGEVEDYQIAIANFPELVLVKRITAINPNLPDTRLFTDFVDDATEDDNNPQWLGFNGTTDTNTYTLGEIDGGQVTPGDVIEYTIYYLSNGNDTAQNVLVCDLIPENTEFISNDFDTLPGAMGGISGSDRGIAWEYNGALESLTNGSDGDRGYYFPLKLNQIRCFLMFSAVTLNLLNTNDAIVVNLGDVPRATASGDPIGFFGFIRFRARVK